MNKYFDLNRSTSTVRPQPFDLSSRLFRIGISTKTLWADVFLRVIPAKMAEKSFYTEGSSFSIKTLFPNTPHFAWALFQAKCSNTLSRCTKPEKYLQKKSGCAPAQ
jgi:hypothetical protein